MHKFYLEFILNTYDDSGEALKKVLSGLGADLEFLPMPQIDSERGRHFKIQISAEDPTVIFDTCAEFGRIKSVKVDES